MTATAAIHNLTPNARKDIRHAVDLAVRYWPNSHLGDFTPREDIRSAFLRIRREVERGQPIQSAVGQVEMDAYRHANM
jgi:hypothetical protein